MRRVAEGSSDKGRVVDRPLPARLIGCPPQRYPGHMNDLKSAKWELADFVGFIKPSDELVGKHVPLPSGLNLRTIC
jgi:hypothetical protein